MTSLVLPTYNPGAVIDRTWAAVHRFIVDRAGHSDPWEAVFVLDGCTDDTADRLARLIDSDDPRFRVIGYPRNRGKGYAVRTGLLAARGAYRIFTDVDLAYPFSDIVRVAETLKGGEHVVVGSRDHSESEVTLPIRLVGYAFRRGLQSQVFGSLARALLPIQQKDTQAGLKGMTAAAAEWVVPALECDGFGFDCELLTACSRSGIKIAEIPVYVRYDTSASTTGLRTTFRMLRELWTIRGRWRNRTLPAPAQASEPPRMSRAA